MLRGKVPALATAEAEAVGRNSWQGIIDHLTSQEITGKPNIKHIMNMLMAWQYNQTNIFIMHKDP